MSLDTGDNISHKQNMVLKVAKKLKKQRRCKILKPLADHHGRYGYTMKSNEGITFYLVARTTPPYGENEIVSIQTPLLNKALENNTPIVMWIPDNIVIFNASIIQQNNYGYNIRFNTEFINFPASLGNIWAPNTPFTLSIKPQPIKQKIPSFNLTQWIS